MPKSIEVSKLYDFPIGDVWKALTDANALSEWLMPCDFVPKVGHEFQFKSKPSPGFDGIVRCKVLELKEPELLSYSWSGGPLNNTVVTFRLTTQGDRTRLDFEHSGFEGFFSSVIVRRILANGWKKKILGILLPQHLSK